MVDCFDCFDDCLLIACLLIVSMIFVVDVDVVVVVVVVVVFLFLFFLAFFLPVRWRLLALPLGGALLLWSFLWSLLLLRSL